MKYLHAVFQSFLSPSKILRLAVTIILLAFLIVLALFGNNNAFVKTKVNASEMVIGFAPTLTTLHHFDLFTDGGEPSNSEALTLSGDTLYGATFNGGANGKGVLFSVSTNGNGYNVIHTFSNLNNGFNMDGANPSCTLKLSGGKLFGTVTAGGTFGNGVLFSVNPDGSAFTPLYNFTGVTPNTGYGLHSPAGELVLSNEILYGVTVLGGSPNPGDSTRGRVFAVNVNGGGTTLFTFTTINTQAYNPHWGLVLFNNKLYGVTYDGGTNNKGTLFTLNTDGTGFSVLHNFTVTEGNPGSRLVLSGNTLYGTTDGNPGVIFSINVNGSDFTVLHTFNSNQGLPSGLIVSGNTLYGSLTYGGTNFEGSIYSIKTDGSEYTTLHSFARFVDGKYPSRLILDNGNLYGMTSSGGNFDKGTIFKLALPTNRTPYDFDGDNKTDASIFRPSNGQWWYQRSSDGVVPAYTFGTSTDKIVPGDYDGDGKTDVAFWRPSTGEWFVLRSSNNTFFAAPFGANGDTPSPGDFDGDGKTDFAVFRQSIGTWFILKTSGGVQTTPFGTAGDIPVVGDYDGDGKSDLAIYRPNGLGGNGEWWLLRSSNSSVFATPFGSATDKPVQGDYTGDGKADCAFFRPSTGQWFVLRSEDLTYFAAPFGTTGDIPVAGDYDGDNKFDFAVFRPSNVTWFVLKSMGGTQTQVFGTTGDIPVPSAFVP